MENKGRTAWRIVASILATALLIAMIVMIVAIGERNRENNRVQAGGFVNPTQSVQEIKPNTSDNSSDKQGSNDSSRNDSSYNQASSRPTNGNYGGKEYLSGKQYRINSYDEYDFDISIGGVEVLPTDEDFAYITYEGDAKLEVSTIEKSRRECLVKISMKNKLFDFNDWDDRYNIKIYLPNNFRDTEVKLWAGNIIFSELIGNKLDVSIDAGNAIIKDCEMTSVDLTVDAGNISMYADNSIRSIDGEVNAGNMTILAPEDISGFMVDYETGMGNFSDKTGFALYTSETGFIGNKEGIIKYGDNSLKIDLEVNIGNATLKTY